MNNNPVTKINYSINNTDIGRAIEIPELPVGGFIKQSLIDYPGNISAVVFTSGCNFRCIYCHNPELVFPELIKKAKKHNPEDILKWINHNKHLLDAVVITGGEPTIHRSLPEFIREIRNMDLKVKLDTNGTHPEILKRLISEKLVDYIAMDIKAPLELKQYRNIAGKELSRKLLNHVRTSIHILEKSGIPFEFRTTLFENESNKKNVYKIAAGISGKLYIQNFRKIPAMICGNLEPVKNMHEIIDSKFKSVQILLRN